MVIPENGKLKNGENSAVSTDCAAVQSHLGLIFHFDRCCSVADNEKSRCEREWMKLNQMNDKCVWMTRDECSHDQPTNDFNDFNLHTFTLDCFVLSTFQCEFVRVSSCCCCCLHLTAAIRFLSTSFFMVDISAISADTQRQIYKFFWSSFFKFSKTVATAFQRLEIIIAPNLLWLVLWRGNWFRSEWIALAHRNHR